MPNSDPRWFAVAALASAAIVLVTFLVMWLLARQRKDLSTRMLPTEGTLETMQPRSRRSGSSTYWTIECRYSYTVGGTSYTGTRARLEFNSYQSEAKAAEAMGGRKAGDRVEVWYDRANPKLATLDRTPPKYMGVYKWGAVVAAAAMVVAAGFLV